MCIVIDTNTMASVFSTSSKDHDQFKPVHDWIIHKNGKIVYGGSTYLKELAKTKKYLKIFRQLKDKGKVVVLSDYIKVDRIEKELKVKFKENKFNNDPHIIAIVTVSKCKIVCTNDISSFKFIQNRLLYPKGISPPKIYTHKRNKNLLHNNNIVGICKPNVILTKKQLMTLPL